MKKIVFPFSRIGMLVFLALLSGCAGMNTQFGCNAKANTGCLAIEAVNAKADGGYFDGTPRSEAGEEIRPNRPLWGATSPTSVPGGPLRTAERIQRIWIAPYQDAANNYHPASVIYTVLEKPRWVGAKSREMKTIETDEE